MAKPLVSDELWQILQPLIPPRKPRRFRYPGRKPLDDRQALTGILFVLKTGNPVGTPTRRNGVRLRHDLLAQAPRVEREGRPGVKQHLLVDANGVPLAGDVTPANVPEIKELLPLVQDCGPRDESERPKHLPKKLYGDRAYDSEPHRETLRARGIESKLAKRNTESGSGLGAFRWVVERTISWLHGFRKMRLVTEKTEEIKFAFFNLAQSLICFRFLKMSLC